MDWNPIFDFLIGLKPIFGTIFAVLGGLVTVGTVVDSLIPDEKDGGFMKKVIAIPVLGDLLKALTRFSPFNIKSDK